jgi:uncharacterized protein (TIGR02466 family)
MDGSARPASVLGSGAFWKLLRDFTSCHMHRLWGARMELLGKQVVQLFPTCLFTGKVSDVGICDRAEKKLRELQKSDLGSFDRTAYVTPDDIWKLDELKALVDLIMKESNAALNFLKVKRDSHYISNMWANITHPNHRHHLHIHPNCLLSGLLYVATPHECGPTVFEDPRPGARIIEPQYTEMTPFNSNRFTVGAEKGRLLIWPSFLLHAVEAGRSESHEDRIVIAFNIMIRATIETITSRLELK